MRPQPLRLLPAQPASTAAVLVLAGVLTRLRPPRLAALALPGPAMLACVLLAVVAALAGGVGYWLVTANPRGAARWAAHAAGLVGAVALVLVALVSWLGPATVIALPVGYLLVGLVVWARRAARRS